MKQMSQGKNLSFNYLKEEIEDFEAIWTIIWLSLSQAENVKKGLAVTTRKRNVYFF